MTTFEVVTTYAPRHWESHACRCVQTYIELWRGVGSAIFLDDELEANSSWLSQFKRRHASLPTHNYRFDAVRFAHKVAAVELAFSGATTDYIIWMDADCVTHAEVDPYWLMEMSQDADFAYLRRTNKYSEMGFFFLRRNEAGAELVRRMVELYKTDALFELAEWHDSFAFDHVRRGMENEGIIQCASLSGNAENTAHPLVNGPLGARLDHCKGNRKQAGRSHASDLKVKRTEAHWNG